MPVVHCQTDLNFDEADKVVYAMETAENDTMTIWVRSNSTYFGSNEISDKNQKTVRNFRRDF